MFSEHFLSIIHSQSFPISKKCVKFDINFPSDNEQSENVPDVFSIVTGVLPIEFKIKIVSSANSRKSNRLSGTGPSHCIFIIPICFRLFEIADFSSIVNNRKTYSAKWDRSLTSHSLYQKSRERFYAHNSSIVDSKKIAESLSFQNRTNQRASDYSMALFTSFT